MMKHLIFQSDEELFNVIKHLDEKFSLKANIKKDLLEKRDFLKKEFEDKYVYLI